MRLSLRLRLCLRRRRAAPYSLRPTTKLRLRLRLWLRLSWSRRLGPCGFSALPSTTAIVLLRLRLALWLTDVVLSAPRLKARRSLPLWLALRLCRGRGLHLHVASALGILASFPALPVPRLSLWRSLGLCTRLALGLWVIGLPSLLRHHSPLRRRLHLIRLLPRLIWLHALPSASIGISTRAVALPSCVPPATPCRLRQGCWHLMVGYNRARFNRDHRSS